MLELSACIEWLFAEEPDFTRRVAEARNAGLEHVEFWGWRDKDLTRLKDALRASGVEVTAMLSDPPGRLVDPAAHDEFLKAVAESAEVAASLSCAGLIVLAGQRSSHASADAQRAAVVMALRRAAPIAAARGVTLLLEPLSSRDDAGDFLDSTQAAIEVIEAVGAPNLRLLYDVYHAVSMGEEPGGPIELYGAHLGHVHLADSPGRHEPGSGRLDWVQMIDRLATSGYTGKIGLEYVPTRGTADSLSLLHSVWRW